jgi:flagellin FlaB
MKANRYLRKREHDEGAVGIGTLIVFIATILVAAVASAVLIDTSNNLQEKAQRTGTEATSQVASNLDVINVVGKILAASGTKIDALNITVGLAPGAKSVDLTQLIVRLSNGTTEKRLNWTSVTGPTTGFNVTEIRDPTSSLSYSAPVLEAGGLAVLNIDLASTKNDMELNTRTDVEVTLIPEVGSSVAANFRTPVSFGTDKVFAVR